jgi:hypothetical protein
MENMIGKKLIVCICITITNKKTAAVVGKYMSSIELLASNFNRYIMCCIGIVSIAG